MFLAALVVIIPTMMLTGSLGAVEDAETLPAPEMPEDLLKKSIEGQCDVLKAWYAELAETYPAGTEIPLIYHPTDEDLDALGLPDAETLQELDLSQAVRFHEDGTREIVDPAVLAPSEHPANNGKGNGPPDKDDGGSDDSSPDSPVASFAGNGCLGIRPGTWVFSLNNGISWCTLAHVYGSPGAYQISTAGHCASKGEVLTVLGLVGGGDGVLDPVLLDFGKVASSHDNGIGDDWALIDVFSAHQPLVTPTMCFWGGPFLGTYEEQGILIQGSWGGQGPGVGVDPNPALVQGIVHYGHGIGVGSGGTPRAAVGASWGSSAFHFVGLIGPGDSGSGANTATTEAAGIITHLIVDPIMRDGVGIAAGTRVTEVGTPTMGLPVGSPVPLAG